MVLIRLPFQAGFLSLLPVEIPFVKRRPTQQIISRNLIEIAKGDQMADGYLVISRFIPGVYLLRYPQLFGYLGLCQSTIFPCFP